jgi:hypothetical protein
MMVLLELEAAPEFREPQDNLDQPVLLARQVLPVQEQLVQVDLQELTALLVQQALLVQLVQDLQVQADQQELTGQQAQKARLVQQALPVLPVQGQQAQQAQQESMAVPVLPEPMAQLALKDLMAVLAQQVLPVQQALQVQALQVRKAQLDLLEQAVLWGQQGRKVSPVLQQCKAALVQQVIREIQELLEQPEVVLLALQVRKAALVLLVRKAI